MARTYLARRDIEPGLIRKIDEIDRLVRTTRRIAWTSILFSIAILLLGLFLIFQCPVQ
jgi:hypothetical protein